MWIRKGKWSNFELPVTLFARNLFFFSPTTQSTSKQTNAIYEIPCDDRAQNINRVTSTWPWLTWVFHLSIPGPSLITNASRMTIHYFSVAKHEMWPTFASMPNMCELSKLRQHDAVHFDASDEIKCLLKHLNLNGDREAISRYLFNKWEYLIKSIARVLSSWTDGVNWSLKCNQNRGHSELNVKLCRLFWQFPCSKVFNSNIRNLNEFPEGNQNVIFPN